MTLASYVLLLAMVGAGALSVGWLIGRRWSGHGSPLPPPRAAAVWMAFASVWVVCALSARWYGDAGLWGWSLAERFAHSGKWFAFLAMALVGFGYSAAASVSQRTHVVALLGVSVCVFVAVWKTCPVYTFIIETVIRGDDGTIRQSTQATCGPVALANAIDMFNGDRRGSERALAMVCGTTCEGTTRWGVWRAALASGFPRAACERVAFEEMERTGSAAIVSIATMPGVNHATLYVGTFENVVILVDPQYGKCTMPRKRFIEVMYGNPVMLHQ
jgi:hypothetical protein